MHSDELSYIIDLLHGGAHRVIVSGTHDAPTMTLWHGADYWAFRRLLPLQADELVAHGAANRRR